MQNISENRFQSLRSERAFNTSRALFALFPIVPYTRCYSRKTYESVQTTLYNIVIRFERLRLYRTSYLSGAAKCILIV